MQDKMYIYGLLDPTVSQIRYIGYTDDVNERYPAHLADASNCRKASRRNFSISAGVGSLSTKTRDMIILFRKF